MLGHENCHLMRTAARVAAGAMLSGILLGASGCGQTASAPKAAPAANASNQAASTEPQTASPEAGDEIAAALAKLSPEDRKLAEAQKTCVVSEGELGSMGTPIKVEHNGKTYFLCCEHCREPFENDPEKYLAKSKSRTDGDPAAASDAGAPADKPAEPTGSGS
jgi:Cu(I)/Ag(I) efflux system membrane fusion protein